MSGLVPAECVPSFRHRRRRPSPRWPAARTGRGRVDTCAHDKRHSHSRWPNSHLALCHPSPAMIPSAPTACTDRSASSNSTLSGVWIHLPQSDRTGDVGEERDDGRLSQRGHRPVSGPAFSTSNPASAGPRSVDRHDSVTVVLAHSPLECHATDFANRDDRELAVVRERSGRSSVRRCPGRRRCARDR